MNYGFSEGSGYSPPAPSNNRNIIIVDSIKDYSFWEWFKTFFKAVPAYILVTLIWSAIIAFPAFILFRVVTGLLGSMLGIVT